MERVAFRMKIKIGQEEEYRKRHEAIWPELQELLKMVGIHKYSIFLDEETGHLFAFLTIKDPRDMEKLKQEPLMWKWWDFMQDIMDTNPDHSPVSHPLKEVFYLP